MIDNIILFFFWMGYTVVVYIILYTINQYTEFDLDPYQLLFPTFFFVFFRLFLSMLPKHVAANIVIVITVMSLIFCMGVFLVWLFF